jgi:hypothetical protein
MTGQYYQQPPPHGMVPPETESTKSLVKIAGIFGIIMAIIGIIVMIWLALIFCPLMIVGLIPVILGFFFYMNCVKINELIDQRQ